LDRLLNETKNGTTTSYTYDSMGNRLTKKQGGVATTYAYDLCNKLLSETTGSEVTEYAYDALGNLTAKTDSTGVTTYAYDALNQLAEIITPDGTWQRNTYDASGIRSMIAENGVTTEFMTFNGLVLSGYNKDGVQTEHYYYGNSLLAVEYAVGNNSANAENDLYYYLKNSHGDVIGLTDNNGTLTETYRYDAFGTLTSIQSLNENGVQVQAETAISRFLYASEQLDATTGMYYLRARQYDTTLGRFTQEDTYLGDGRNLYVYVSNNPLKYVDPSGQCSKFLGYPSAALHTHMLPAEIVEFQNQKEEVEKAARKNAVLNGAYDVLKGGLETATGTLVTVASVPVMLVNPIVGISGGTAGAGYANMGLSDMSEGVQDIYNGFTGKVDASFNPTRDTCFGGNQTNYNYAEAILGGANFIFGVSIPNIPLGLPSSGSIMEYANAGSQMMDFLDVMEETIDAYVPNNITNLWGQEQYVGWDNLNIIKEHLSGSYSDVFNDTMIERLEDAYYNNTPISGADLDFYAHELYESNLMQNGMGYDEAHRAALEYYNAKEFNLYSPDVIKSFPEYFNQMWYDFWGIEGK